MIQTLIAQGDSIANSSSLSSLAKQVKLEPLAKQLNEWTQTTRRRKDLYDSFRRYSEATFSRAYKSSMWAGRTVH